MDACRYVVVLAGHQLTKLFKELGLSNIIYTCVSLMFLGLGKTNSATMEFAFIANCKFYHTHEIIFTNFLSYFCIANGTLNYTAL